MDTATIQDRLTGLGFPVGPIDGVMGPLTRKALAKFQAKAKLPVTGVPDMKTIEHLRKSENAGVVVMDDPAQEIKTLWPRQVNVGFYYGEPGKHQVLLPLPFPMKLAWDKTILISRMSLHEKCAESADRCFERIARAYSASDRAKVGIDIFGGSLNVRKMRGGSAWSMHSWGIAIDFDPERNQLRWGRDKARLAKPDAEAFWRIWEAEGWVSLGRERNYDWMHVQAARL